MMRGCAGLTWATPIVCSARAAVYCSHKNIAAQRQTMPTATIRRMDLSLSFETSL
eukprot:m.380391 g.380391  ORF g.380391 m.380391 type:complete len:55 (+) comp56228_c0_seq2:3129-3293(+)